MLHQNMLVLSFLGQLDRMHGKTAKLRKKSASKCYFLKGNLVRDVNENW